MSSYKHSSSCGRGSREVDYSDRSVKANDLGISTHFNYLLLTPVYYYAMLTVLFLALNFNTTHLYFTLNNNYFFFLNNYFKLN